MMSSSTAPRREATLVRRGKLLEWSTLSSTGEHHRRFALRLIGFAFIALAGYLLIQSAVALATRHHASPSAAGIAWTGVTAIMMFGWWWADPIAGCVIVFYAVREAISIFRSTAA
jgi:hypothetical protein